MLISCGCSNSGVSLIAPVLEDREVVVTVAPDEGWLVGDEVAALEEDWLVADEAAALAANVVVVGALATAFGAGPVPLQAVTIGTRINVVRPMRASAVPQIFCM